MGMDGVSGKKGISARKAPVLMCHNPTIYSIYSIFIQYACVLYMRYGFMHRTLLPLPHFVSPLHVDSS